MEPQVFRPSAKLVHTAYLLVLLLFVAVAGADYGMLGSPSPWLLLIPIPFVLIPLRMHLRQLATKLTIDAEHLILEVGLLAKATRTLNIGKVQDVTVAQSIMQRILGIGDLRVETAGQGSAILAESFDKPKEIAALILRTAHHDAHL